MGLFSKSKHSKKNNGDFSLPVAASDQSENTETAHKANRTVAPHALTASEVLNGFSDYTNKNSQKIEMSGSGIPVSPLDKLRKKVTGNTKEDKSDNNLPLSKAENAGKGTSVTVKPNYLSKDENGSTKDETLLEKCMPFITEGGKAVPQEKPAYTLESFDSIINLTEKKFEKLFEDLELNKVNITYDALPNKKTPVKANGTVSTSSDKKIVITEIPMHHVDTKPEVTTISDIDDTSSFTETIPFSALGANKEFEDISSGTKVLDLSSEMFDKAPESNKEGILPEQNSEDDFEVEYDYKSPKDLKSVAGRLMKKRKIAFIRAFLTVVITALASLALIPDLNILLLSAHNAFKIGSLVILTLVILINSNIISAIKSLFTPRKLPEASVGICAVACALYSVIAVLENVNPYNSVLCCAVLISIKAIAEFMRANTLLGNFKIVASKNEKFGIKFIDDRQTTFAMARNSIDGDVLVASSVKTSNILDFLKNSYSDSAMCGILAKFSLAAIIVAVITGLTVAVRAASAVAFFEIVTYVLFIAFAPSVMLTDILPLRRAGKKLNTLNAAVMGTNAARHIDSANALTLTSAQLFPDNTVALHDMKILDTNKIDLTLINAAAIANEIDSPLKSIFNSIANTTSVDIPKADNIKYEERLGISGWVGESRIFIGNRTLLEAHGILTPSIEVDKKILRNGYFPVYVASDGKPCALLTVKYNVKRDIAFRMQKLSATGITFLVDSCDPNLTGEMICDYFGLYEESVKVMSGLGCQLNKNATEYQKDFSSVAVYKGSLSALAELFNAAGKIKKSVKALTLFHIISSCAFLMYYVYSILVDAVIPLGNLIVLAGNSVLLIAFLIVYLLERP